MQLRVQHDGSGTLCREILATLPTWFGIEDAAGEGEGPGQTGGPVDHGGEIVLGHLALSLQRRVAQ